jgi:hypothetical protein
MVAATQQAVAEVRKSLASEEGGARIAVGFHAEAPEW